MSRYEHILEDQIIINDIIYKLHDNADAKVVGNKIEHNCHVEIPATFVHADIEYTVRTIGRKSFYGNRFIDSVELPWTTNLVEYGAFMESSIKELNFMQVIPHHIVVLESCVCQGCNRLESVYLAAGVEEIPDFCFHQCFSLNEINTPNGLKKIHDMAFSECQSLSHFDFVDGIAEIGESAFQSTNLNYAEIGYHVKKVGQLCFSFIDNLKTMVILGVDADFGEHFMKNDQRVITYIRAIDKSVIVKELKNQIESHHWCIVDDFMMLEKRGCKFIRFTKNVVRLVGYNETNLMRYLVIPSKIAGINVVDFQTKAFAYSRKINTCEFPNTILRIRGKVFEGCSNLKNVTFNHKIDKDEAEWVVSNNQAHIIYNYKET